VTKRVPLCDASVIDAAVKSAAAAFPAWRDTPPLRRARVMQEFLNLLKQHQKELAKLVTEEHGKTLPDAMGSVQRGIEVVEFACGIPHLLKGEYSETSARRSTRTRCASPWASASASRRSTSR
jgi:malonate-semialdehyde dehydrogenase (acetylating)/methylmalonate-semialdehyde dehydrogenase